MRYVPVLLLSFLALGVAVTLTGCSSSAQSSPASSEADHADHDEACCAFHKKPAKQAAPAEAAEATQEKKDEVAEELAKLPPADRELAKAQKICPVTDEPLGSMGTPIKLSVKGQTVFICCEGCEDSLKKNPDQYLKKIKR